MDVDSAGWELPGQAPAGSVSAEDVYIPFVFRFLFSLFTVRECFVYGHGMGTKHGALFCVFVCVG